ncbi:MAG TPA: rhodanese-like domain-containing protein [Cyclobacteriaceae bacterium]
MKKYYTIAFLTVVSVVCCYGQLPFKFDSLYKTIHAKDFCMLMQKHPDLLLIDVRSAGEYRDTSRYTSLNQGHLKGAINLNIDDIKNNVSIMNPYKDKTIVLYCSHSQRSRRVSKLLTENGFTNFYNLNGGMSVLNQLTEADFPCKKDLIVSALPFQNLSFAESANLIRNEKQLVVIDVRSSSQFASRDTIPQNNVGRIKGAINIPYQDIVKRGTESINKYKEQPVLIYTSSGDGDAARMASDLVRRGFKHVYQLLGGIQNFIASQEDISMIENATPFTLINAQRTLALLKNTKLLTIYDTRANDDYNNKLTGMISYKNLGRIKNAIHVEQSAFDSQTLPTDKNSSILVYGNDEAFKFVSMLTAKGYKHVYLLDSLYDFVWSGFNIESCKEARNFVENHAGLY